MVLRLIVTSLFLIFFEMGGPFAQAVDKLAGGPEPARPVATGTVGIVTGDIDGTGIRIASGLSRVLDSGNDLRIKLVRRRRQLGAQPQQQ